MSSDRQRTICTTGRLIRRFLVALCVLAAYSPASFADTVRDDFSDKQWDNNDGSVAWSGDWIEVDGRNAPPSPDKGNVKITNGGELQFEDKSNPKGQASAAREANLLGATTATLSFDWDISKDVDGTDSIVIEISPDGGGSWILLEDFTGYSSASSGSRAYDIAAFATANTQVRIRINNGYDQKGERFKLDFIEIDFVILLAGTELSVTQTDTPDSVNVASNLAYSLTVTNAGPEDATGVSVTDTLPIGVVFLSASATQGSCSQVGGIVTCPLGDLLAGATATINIVVTAPVVTGVITNNATVTGNEVDPVPGNNSNDETTTVQNLNINQLCYLVADKGGANGGNDLFTRIDTADFNPATNETNYGTGTGTTKIEAMAINSANGFIYAADAGQLGILSTATGLFQALPQVIGSGSGSVGNVVFNDVDGLAYDPVTGVLYGAHRRNGGGILIQIDMTTGARVANAFGPGVDYVVVQPVLGNTIVDDIAIDPTTGTLYAAVNSGGSTDRLIVVDKMTGATVDVALITVPDIEGLGTDSTGQLWGTSGTQNILYEIDKVTGVGFNGRSIDNGQDYESVDCFAVSPTVTADLSVTKTVDDTTPPVGNTVSYLVTVMNAGPGVATIVQIMDLLPAGVSFVSAAPGQGTYDSITGDWYVGNLAIGSSVSLTLQASVDAGTENSTITNTASVDFLSQTDPNPVNDIAAIDIIPLGPPSLLVLKAATVLEDPFNGTTNPKAILGATISYIVVTTNTGSGPVDSNTLVVTDPIPANVALLVTDFDGATAGPVQFVDGATASGLNYTFVTLNDLTDDVAFSDDGGATFDYLPTADINGIDLAVTNIRINPKGDFVGNTGAGDPSLRLAFKAIIL